MGKSFLEKKKLLEEKGTSSTVQEDNPKKIVKDKPNASFKDKVKEKEKEKPKPVVNNKDKSKDKSKDKGKLEKKKYTNVKIMLCMIEKNEEHILTKSSLPCAAHFVNSYCIDDTGSTDRSKEIITEFFNERNITGRICDTPWTRKFDQNRTANLKNAMQYLSEIADDQTLWYMYFMDADDLLLGGNPEDFEYQPHTQLEAPAPSYIAKPEDNLPGNYPGFNVDKELLLRDQPDIINVIMKNGEITYPRPSFVRYDSDLLYHYKGVCHESIELRKDSKIRKVKFATLDNVYYVGRSLGARSQNPLKYIIDANVMIEELEIEKDPSWLSRYTYYIAQSIRDSEKKVEPGEIIELGNEKTEYRVYDPFWSLRESEKWYMERAKINDQDSEERYIAYLEAARTRKWLHIKTGIRVPFDCDERLFKASYLAKDRLEALTELLHINNERRDYLQSWRLAKGVLNTLHMTPLKQSLFIEVNTYNYRFRDVAAHAAFNIGLKEEAKELWEQILNLPPSRLCSLHRYKCIYDNIRLCLK